MDWWTVTAELFLLLVGAIYVLDIETMLQGERRD